MKGHIRNHPPNKPFAFIRSSSGMDNIFLHRDAYHGDWNQLIRTHETQKIYVEFELTEGLKGPRAEKCARITEDEYNNKD